ncbi:MAG: branched-chain amino acid ABC transporter ATP-binding protein/permease [Acetobacteraceae bacterium]
MKRGPANLLPEAALAVTLVVMPFVFPHVGGSFDMMERILNWGLLGLGFDLLFGWAGLLSFGQAAFYGTGGFVAAYLLGSGVLASVWLALLVGTLAAGVFGLLVGYLAVRRIGIYFAMITLAFGQMAYFLENSPLARWTGGENGISGVPVPTLGFGDYAIQIGTGRPMYVLLAVVFFVGFALARRIANSPFGVILRAIKANTARVAMLGHAVPGYKLAAFVIAALYAGLAGGMLGVLQSYMPPEAFSLDTSGELVVQTIIGGAGTLIGSTVGATIWLYARDNLQFIPGIGAFWKFFLGLIFIILVTALRRGICGEIAYLWRQRRAASRPPPEPAVHGKAMPLRAPMVNVRDDVPALEARAVSKHYGGLRAVDNVSFSVRTGSVHAVIGPNGAGKSTMFKMLLDEIHPTHGEVRLFGHSISGNGATRAAQLGIGKSNQLNQLFVELTVRENIRIAALARGRGVFRLDILRRADGIADVEHQIGGVLETVELTHRAETPVSELAYGEKRRLEIGLALATGPNVLLLDEPLAGMSPAERTSTRSLLKEIGRDRTLLIVEHDMDAIFELADRITVLYDGRLLADGSPVEIQNSQAVQDAYLGGLHEHEPA